MVQFVEGMETTVCESQVTFVELGDFELDREAPSIEPRGPELRVHGDYRADDKWMEQKEGWIARSCVRACVCVCVCEGRIRGGNVGGDDGGDQDRGEGYCDGQGQYLTSIKWSVMVIVLVNVGVEDDSAEDGGADGSVFRTMSGWCRRKNGWQGLTCVCVYD